MSQPLMHIHDLISESWQDFKKHWNESLRISVWFLFGSLAHLLVGAIGFPLFAPKINTQDTLYVVLFYIGAILIEIIGGLITLWAGLRLNQWALAKDRGEDTKPLHIKINFRLVLSAVWIAILTGLAAVGGFVLFILPGIWLTILFQFSQFSLLEDQKHGTQALAHSAALVKGRWWATLWRLIVPGFLFYILFYVCSELIQAIVGLIAGVSLSASAVDAAGNLSPIVLGTLVFAEGFSIMIFAALFSFAQVKLFHSIKRTQ